MVENPARVSAGSRLAWLVGMALLAGGLAACAGSPSPAEDGACVPEGSPAAVTKVVSLASSSEARTAVKASDGTALDTSGVDGAAVVGGATANTPAPVLSAQVAGVVGGLLSAQVPVSVVRVAGTPELGDLQLMDLGGTEIGRQARLRGNLGQVEEALLRAPATDGADYLAALLMAADGVRSTGAEHPLLVVIGSGLSDTGVLAMTEPGMLGAEPADVLAQLGEAVSPTRLAGVDVLWSGLGWTTSPQAPLTDAQRTRLTSLWVGVLSGLGATPYVDVAPFGGASICTDRTVATVMPAPEPTVSAPPTCSTRTVVFDQTSGAAFQPDGVEWVSPAEAESTLDALVQVLVDNPTVTVGLRGTTTDAGDPAARNDLALRRAQVVAQYLVSRGIAAEWITSVVGAGSDFPEFEPDRDAQGVLLAAPAARNRAVRVDLTFPC